MCNGFTESEECPMHLVIMPSLAENADVKERVLCTRNSAQHLAKEFRNLGIYWKKITSRVPFLIAARDQMLLYVQWSKSFLNTHNTTFTVTSGSMFYKPVLAFGLFKYSS